MPLFFFIIGFVLIDSGFRGNAQALYQQFASDAKGFVALGAIIIILGACGVSSSLRPVAKGMLFLVFVVFFVRNGNEIVSGLESAVNSSASSSPSDSSSTSMPASATGQGVASSTGSAVTSAANSIAGTANGLANTANSVTNAVSSVTNDVEGIVGLFSGL
jgi:hypothetical protein